MTLDEMKTSIWQYSFNEKDNGMAIIMRPYSETLGEDQLEQIYNYIQTLKK